MSCCTIFWHVAAITLMCCPSDHLFDSRPPKHLRTLFLDPFRGTPRDLFDIYETQTVDSVYAGGHRGGQSRGPQFAGQVVSLLPHTIGLCRWLFVQFYLN